MASLHLHFKSLNPNNSVLHLNDVFVDVHINDPKIMSRQQTRVSVCVKRAELKSLRLDVMSYNCWDHGPECVC